MTRTSIAATHFDTQIQQFQYWDKYARWRDDLGRRETWKESVDRAVEFLAEISEYKLPSEVYDRIHDFMLEQKAFCSMRLFAMAGKAARRNGISIFNCAYTPIDSIDSIVETLAISMAGCGVGFSVEKQYVEQLPTVSYQSPFSSNYQIRIIPKDDEGEEYITETSSNGYTKPSLTFVIPDSAKGWCDALRVGLINWLGGNDVTFDYSRIRPAGSILKTKGGRASGSQPLRKLLDFARETILNAQGRKLRPIEVHDIVTTIGGCAVSGGSRRSAQISLFDFDDEEMRHAKDDGWWKHAPQRANANNSIVIDKELSHEEVEDLILTMHRGGGGEPGIASRRAMRNTIPERRDGNFEFGFNPCSEVILRPRQFCNLSQAIARPNDTFGSIKEKVEVATIIGVIQSLVTNFPGLRDDWAENQIDERLCGVDITGQLDVPHLMTPLNLEQWQKHSNRVAREYSEMLGINMPAAIQVCKPSGNSSILFDCSPGLHSRWSEYYIRRMRVNANSPLRHVLEQSGFTLYPENGQEYKTANTMVVEFPVKSPDGAIVNGERSAVEQCEWWLKNKIFWTEHNPSATIYYSEDELDDLVDWIYEHQELVGGLSFLPRNNGYYPLAPYESITEEEYGEMAANTPEIDFSLLQQIESEDNTTVAQELACFAGSCEI